MLELRLKHDNPQLMREGIIVIIIKIKKNKSNHK